MRDFFFESFGEIKYFFELFDQRLQKITDFQHLFPHSKEFPRSKGLVKLGEIHRNSHLW